MEDSREEQWRDVVQDVQDKSKIHALSWGVNTKESKELIKRFFRYLFRIRKGETLFVLA